MEIKNDKAASAGPHAWEPGDVVDVPDDLAAELVAIKDAGFYQPDNGPRAFDPDQQRREALSAATIGPSDHGRGATKASEFPAEDALITEVDPAETVPEVDPEEVPAKVPAKK